MMRVPFFEIVADEGTGFKFWRVQKLVDGNWTNIGWLVVKANPTTQPDWLTNYPTNSENWNFGGAAPARFRVVPALSGTPPTFSAAANLSFEHKLFPTTTVSNPGGAIHRYGVKKGTTPVAFMEHGVDVATWWADPDALTAERLIDPGNALEFEKNAAGPQGNLCKIVVDEI